MKRLPERYYDLVLERDQLLEESEYILNQTPVDALRFIDLTSQILSLEEEIKEIEKEMDEPKKMYIIAREAIDAFHEQIEELLELFTDATNITNENGLFHIEDVQEAVTLILYIVDIDE